MKKRIGIITILKVNNYGAELQAYATQKVLQLMGYDAEIVDYLFYKNPRHKRTKMSAPTVKLPLKKRLAERLLPLISRWKLRNYGKEERIRTAKFNQFHEDNTRLSVCYDSLDKLKSSELDYDVLLTGSDQVWNPGTYSNLDPYLLRFGNEKIKRVAYASSFGVTSVPEEMKQYYKDALSAYDAIGVREDKAVDLVKNLCGKEAKLVLDPTLLLDKEQWMKVAKETYIPAEPYILIYELSNIPYIKKVAQHISRQTGMPIVRVCKDALQEDKEQNIINVIDAGPAEFIYLIEKAAWVVTNSFHGTAFSLNFGKQFYTVIPKGKSNNSRQKSILKLTGCEDRMLIEDADFPEIKLFDTTAMTTVLNKERQNSIIFLRHAIDEE